MITKIIIIIIKFRETLNNSVGIIVHLQLTILQVLMGVQVRRFIELAVSFRTHLNFLCVGIQACEDGMQPYLDPLCVGWREPSMPSGQKLWDAPFQMYSVNISFFSSYAMQDRSAYRAAAITALLSVNQAWLPLQYCYTCRRPKLRMMLL